MIIDFSMLDIHERPTLILRNAGGTPLGVLTNATNVEPRLMYNEVSELSFELPAYADGVATPMYNEVVGMRIIDLQGIGQFILLNPKESGDGVTRKKICTAYSLEYEFARKKITIPNGTYKFYDPERLETTLLGMLLDGMPSWKIGTVPISIMNKYRTFEVNGENRYSFIKDTVQRTYGCIFNFNTYTRTIYIDDISRTPNDQAVYLSTENLATSIEVEELSKDIKTRLDVNGADGISIRDVNPNGTNWLLNLDYYMTPLNFSQGLIDKYHAWIRLNGENRQAFYNLSVQHTLSIERRVAEEARLTDLKGEMTSLENLQAVTIQAISQKLEDQTSLDEINSQIATKQEEIDKQAVLIEELNAEAENLFSQMRTIRDTCSYENYFTQDERIAMDRYIIEDGIEDASFVAATTSYVPSWQSSSVDDNRFVITGAVITTGIPASGGMIYDMKGGILTLGDRLSASIISATIDSKADKTFVASFYLSDVVYAGEKYPQACFTLTGNSTVIVAGNDLTSLSFGMRDANSYFTLNVSEYEKRSIAWELYEFGATTLEKLSRPSYTFSVSSANFFAHEDFAAFRSALRLGERIYLALDEDEILKPVCIGVTFTYDDYDSLELLFSDKYVAGDGGNTLIDLLEQSVSMGKTLNANQFAYSQFTDTGANTSIAQFMTSALDVAKNALFSSSGNAVSWDGSGLRLRKWTDASQTAYDPEQQWLTNNSIVLTADNWKTAQMAIGKFSDDNLGECWGVVAPTIVGTMLAGTRLIIESEKRDGGVAVFRVDEDGAKLYNSNFLIANDHRNILLHPDIGVVIGPVGSYTVDEKGAYVVNTNKANFHVDDLGNVFMRGAITATELHIGNQTIQEYLGTYVSENVGNASTLVSPDAPVTGFKVGDFWRDSDSPYHYLYTAVSTTGDPTKDWVLVSAQIIEGAAIHTDANAGTIDIVAGSTLNIASGKTLNIAGAGSVNISSSGGINLLAGHLSLGSAVNKLTSDGILSLAGGNILLHGPNNEVTVGKDGGVVNIGTDGTGTINLATYQVRSSTESTTYSATYSAGGNMASANTTSQFSYTTTDESGAQSPSSFTVTTTYTRADLTTNAAPSITSGKLIQIVYEGRGIDIYADASKDQMILAPSVPSGHLMGWDLVSANTIAATQMSASSIVANSMFLPNTNGGLVSVADQKWTIDKIMEVLNNNNIIPSLKAAEGRVATIADTVSVHTTSIDLNTRNLQAVIGTLDVHAQQFEIYGDRLDVQMDAINNNARQISTTAQTINTVVGTVDELGNWKQTASVTIDGLTGTVSTHAAKIENYATELENHASLISNNADTISNHATVINNHTTTLNTQAQDIRTNATNIQINADQIEVVADGLEVLTDSFSLRAEQIDLLGGSVDELGQWKEAASVQINGLTGTVSTHATKIESYATELTNHASLISNNAGTISNHATVINNHTTTLNTHAQDIKTNAENISVVSDALEVLTDSFNLRAEQIDLIGGSVDELGQWKEAASVQINGLTGEINAKATVIQLQTLGNDVDNRFGSVNSQLGAVMVRLSDVENELYLQAGTISAKADLVRVEALETEITGLLKVDELQAKIAALPVISNGSIQSENVDSTHVECSSIDVNSALYASKATIGAYDFATHSHVVSVSGDGTLQLGEVSSTGGSFNIADTQFYKNGVSAAETSVYVTSMSGSGGIITAKLSNDREGTMFLSTGTPENNVIPIVSGGSTIMTVNANSIYNNGWNDCLDAASSWRVLINYYEVGETLYDVDGNVATGPWYKGTEAYRYSLPNSK